MHFADVFVAQFYDFVARFVNRGWNVAHDGCEVDAIGTGWPKPRRRKRAPQNAATSSDLTAANKR
jgi:hypothetical protein